MANCLIKRDVKTNKLLDVKAPNGKSSILYRDILHNLSDSIEIDNYLKTAINENYIKDNTKEEIALGIWSKTRTKTFNKWFGNSKIIDKNGEPMLLSSNNEQVKKWIEANKGNENTSELSDEIPFILSENNKAINLYKEGNYKIHVPKSYFGLSANETNKIDPELENKIKSFLSSAGVKYEEVEQIFNKKGQPINAYGVADLTSKLVQVTKGRNIKTLPEEAGHMVTALLGKNHPIVKQMMNEITDFSLYQHVKDQYKDTYKTDAEFRFEAVGKLIGEYVIGNNKLDNANQTSKVKQWFNRVIKVLKRMFLGTNTNIPGEAVNSFDLVAKEILKTSNSTLLKEMSTEEKLDDITYYQLKDDVTPKNQFEIADSFIKSKNRLSGIVKVNDKDRYKLVDGKIVKYRVSDKTSALFEKGKTKAQLDKIRSKPKSVLGKKIGTELHNYNEQLMNFIISTNKDLPMIVGDSRKALTTHPEIPSIINKKQSIEVQNSLVYLIKEVAKVQDNIDASKKAMVFTENFVLDDESDTGGSQDLIIIYSDGSASIYDYKFMNFETKNINGKIQVPEFTDINFIKEQSFNIQIGEYKRILKDIYGINKFRATRILPFNMQFKYEKGVPTGKLYDLEGFKTSKNYLMPLPVARELSEDKHINEILISLFNQEDILTAKLRQNYNNPLEFKKYQIELSALKKSIKHIQVFDKPDFQPLFDSINVTLNNESNIVKTATINNIGELNRIHSEIELFLNLYKNLVLNIKDSSLKEKLNDISTRLINAKDYIEEKRKEILINLNPDLIKIQKEINSLESMFSYTSAINHPVFETFNDLLKKATGNSHRALTEVFDNLENHTNNLKAWAKSNNISLFDAYRLIKNDKERLINKMSKEFYKQRAKATEEGNIKWLKVNYRMTEEGKTKFKEDYNKEITLLKSKFEEDSNIFKMRLQYWLDKNDLKNNPEAWTNKWALYNYAEIKNESNHYSSEYKNLLNPSNKPLLDYYNFYQKTNKELNRLVSEDIKPNFIANIKKDSVEMFSQNSGLLKSFKQIWKDMQNSILVQQDDKYLSNDFEEDKIPLLYYNSFMTKDENGQWKADNANKSEDLSKNLLLFSEAVLHKSNLIEIRDIVESLKLYIASQPVIKTDYRNRTIIKDGITQVDYKSTKNADLFNKQVLALLYGKKIQNKDTVFLDKYSTNKVIANIMGVFSANTLALNYVSAFGNISAGVANVYIKGVEGRYYNRKQVRKALSLIPNRGNDDIYNRIGHYFNIESDRWSRKLASKLSASKLTANLTYDKLYYIWQKGDEFTANVTLVSMAQNYGINPKTQQVERLALLPEGTKSIYDNYKIINDKPDFGLNDEQYDDFRRKVVYVARKIKGSNTTEEMSSAQMTIWLKSFMFFKNWLPPMAAERFGRLKYTKDLNEFEYGRFRSVFKDVLNRSFYKTMPRIALDLVSLGAIRYKGDTALLERQYKDFIDHNPEMRDTLSREDYIELRERTIRSGIYELRLVTGLYLLMAFAAGLDLDDNKKKDYKENFATKEMFKLTRRAYLELSFFSNPNSVTQLINNPLPIISVFNNLWTFGGNTLDETADRLLFREGKEIDKTPVLHYAKRFSPFKRIFELFDDMKVLDSKEIRKNNLKDKDYFGNLNYK